MDIQVGDTVKIIGTSSYKGLRAKVDRIYPEGSAYHYGLILPLTVVEDGAAVPFRASEVEKVS